MSELIHRVEQIRATTQELRQSAGQGRNTRRLIDSIFRQVHSFKAAAAANGRADLSDVAHEFENLLHALRTGQAKLDDTTLQVFDETIEALLGNRLSDSEIEALLSHAEDLTSRIIDLEALVPPEIRNSLRDDQRHRLTESLREGARLYLIETSFELADFDVRFQQLKELLESTGEVIANTPQSKNNRINFRILYTSLSDVAQLRETLAGISNVTITEPSTVHSILQQAVTAGKAAATSVGKEIDFVVRGSELALDKSLGDALIDPLVHLVRNAVAHGIEPLDERLKLGKDPRGTVRIEVEILDTEAQITVTDDGRGIEPAHIPLLFQPGFTTATEVSTLSGRGVGLDAVKTAIEKIGGTIEATSELGQGASFQLTAPLTSNQPSDA